MRLKALIADDELHILQNLNAVIRWERLDIEVVGLARTGEQALALATEHGPHLVLSDIRMPNMDGLRFVEALKKAQPDVRVLMITGYQDYEYARTMIRLGVSDYILKPIDYEGLETTIRELASDIRERLEERRLAFDGQSARADAAGAEAAGAERPPRKKSREQLMKEAGEFIRRNLGRDFGLEDVADHLGISNSYFSLLFKQTYGETFVEHVTRSRIEKAKTLLVQTPYSVTEIGKAVGYADRRYFTKVFQRLTGTIPSEYRERHLTKEDRP